MRHSIEALRDYTIQARDGEIGQLDTVFFDDLAWVVRYLVVNTGSWLFGRRVLISPAALVSEDWSGEVLPVNLTRQQVKEAPGVDLEKPVHRQHEVALSNYYGWPAYWSNFTDPSMATVALETAVQTTGDETEGNEHLRSAQEVAGYHIQARDGEIGHVEDFIADSETWNIHYIVVDTQNWLPGRKVLVSPQWIEKISWAERKVHVDLQQETIANSPEYDPDVPLDRAYEARLHDHYGRSKYWQNSP